MILRRGFSVAEVVTVGWETDSTIPITLTSGLQQVTVSPLTWLNLWRMANWLSVGRALLRTRMPASASADPPLSTASPPVSLKEATPFTDAVRPAVMVLSLKSSPIRNTLAQSSGGALGVESP